MLRILAVSDLRVQDISLLAKTVAQVRPDLILYAGDDVVRFGPGSDSWAPVAAAAPLGLAGVIGNDCLRKHAVVFDQAGCHDLERAPLLLDDLAIIGLGGAPKDEAGAIGYTLYSRSAAQKHLAQQLSLAGKRRVLLVSHAPPLGVLDISVRFGVRNMGSSVVGELLRHPQVIGVICGHAHSQGGRVQVVDGRFVVNVASEDSVGSPLRYAVIEWCGHETRVTIGVTESESDREEVSRIQGVGYWKAKKLADSGFDTLSSLLAGDGTRLAAVVGDRIARRYRAAARAYREQVPVFLEPEEPFPSDALVVDVETSADRKDDPWLVGTMAWPDQEVTQFEELDETAHAAHLSRIGTEVNRLGNATMVMWGTYDRAALARAHERVNLPCPEWLSPERCFDACSWVKSSVALPVRDYGLKAVAAFFRYPFAEEGLDEFTVGLWYTFYRDQRMSFPLERVRAYNKDDVAAVRHVVRELQRLARSGRALTEPPIPIPMKYPPARQQGSNGPVERAIAAFAASLMPRVKSGELRAEARDRAVAKYAEHMRSTYRRR